MNQSKNKTKAEERSSHVHTYFDTIYKYIDLYFRYFIIRSNSTKPSIILSQKVWTSTTYISLCCTRTETMNVVWD